MTINFPYLCALAILGIAAAKVCPVIDLKSAATFAILGGSTIANTGPSTIAGNVGLAPGTAITGFAAGVISAGFGEYAGVLGIPSKSDLNDAILQANAMGTAGYFLGGTIDLGNRMLLPANYYVTTTLGILSGDVRLDARGDETGMFVFKMVCFPLSPPFKP
jgi:hypothetical protein